MDSYYSFRWRRLRRRWLKRVMVVVGFLRLALDRYVIRRGSRLKYVQRFIASWMAIFIVGLLGLWWQSVKLDSYYLTDVPSQGGTYVEGVVGEFSSLNPIFAETLPAKTANRLIFSGLMRHDKNGKIELDLAKDWEIDGSLTEYTFKLKDNLKWHDGAPLTARDVAFTIRAIQNSAVESPLRDNWQGVSVKAPDAKTVVFKIGTPSAPFIHLLTVGTIPEHILGDVTADQLRVHEFNQSPVGSGPYMADRYLPNQNEIHLRAFQNYVHGLPNISRFVVRAYSDHEEVVQAFKKRLISGSGGIDYQNYTQLHGRKDLYISTSPLASQTFLFINVKSRVANKRIFRQAIVRAIDAHKIAKNYSEYLQVANSPLLPEHLGFRKDVPQLGTNVAAAKKLLKKSAYKGAGIKLLSPSNDFYPQLAASIKEQLAAVGVKINLKFADQAELQSSQIPKRKYDMLLYTVALGADPDSYAYWHSSQAGPQGFNLSNYESAATDEALEAGRTRNDPRIRAAKYKVFLETWRADAPAVALFRHMYPYVYRGLVNLDLANLVEPLDRLNYVNDWALINSKQLKRTAN